ncbi:CubicO group peptidase (beta-lactamase class C family) [Chitinophaga dinghuensis]|uniref:CubicO group peptidase (Beta-lactamase class C family) n=1 Tax=Chitinophaga dinghuensis TaxID=1539050 RepID=A0A327VK59_9BACT|nr:serine hydrolase domain-containing protein [Chitinophaga dinghuensis]RAJ75090.1 CubicO group peptidase (beta-lactamase class C family) [Chitinophaga dinghuensis]
MKTIISTLLLAGLTYTTTAQVKPVVANQLEHQIDQFATRKISTGEITGTTILVLKDGKPIYNKSFGYADTDTKKPMQNDNIFRVASFTKAVTSVAALMLLEEGRFRLDEPVSKYIPAFAQTKVLDTFNAADSSYTTKPLARPITIRDIMTHTSGIEYGAISYDPRIHAIFSKAGLTVAIGTHGSLEDFINKLAAAPLIHQPGEAFTYGLNVDVLGRLVEIWSGQTLEQFFQQRIFTPLGMKDTYFHLPASKANRLVTLQEKGSHGLQKITHPIFESTDPMYPLDTTTFFSGGGGLSSTAADYARFLLMLQEGGTVNGHHFLSPATIALFTSNQLMGNANSDAFQFGLGVAVISPRNKHMLPISVGSFYWCGAFNTHYWVDPAKKIIGIILTQEHLPEDFFGLGQNLQHMVYGAL